jgi:hypothetical protein
MPCSSMYAAVLNQRVTLYLNQQITLLSGSVYTKIACLQFRCFSAFYLCLALYICATLNLKIPSVLLRFRTLPLHPLF